MGVSRARGAAAARRLLWRDVSPAAPDGHNQTFRAQRLDGLPDGPAGHAVFLHELALGGQGIAWPILTRLDVLAKNRGQLGVQRGRVEMVNVISGHVPYRN